MEKRFSVIVPVYNRADEVKELLESLAVQTCKDFEVMIVEDGSPLPCRDVVESFADRIRVEYIAKPNEGRSIARNAGMEKARGEWLVFFDSDCIIPSDYFEKLEKELERRPDLDCFGGPDAAHESFTDTQKAINQAMTSFLTTGGIRGGSEKMDRFVPRTFNMGFRRSVFERVGGFREMFSEDIDMSTRIRQAGYKIGLIRNLPVWHKRRVDFRKFMRQVWVFGMSRITLKLLYPDSLKPVHALPAVAVVMCVALIVLSLTVSRWFIVPVVAWLVAVMVSALVATKSLKIALLAVPASIIQIGGYGCGFLQAWFTKIVLRRGRDISREIEMRRGK